MSHVTTQSVRRFPVLSALDEEALTTVAESARYRAYERGAPVTEDADAAFFFVRSGSVRLFCAAPTGREITLALREAGDGFSVALDRAGRSQTHAEALSDGTSVYRVPRQALLDLAGAQPRATGALGDLYDHWCMDLCDQLNESALTTIEARLGHMLARLAHGTAGTVVRQTQAELATLIGTSQQEVNKALRHFHRAGLTAKRPDGRLGIVVLHPADLAAL